MANMLRILALLLLWTAPAAAQWQVPNHATPQGRGAGITGFSSFGPCSLNIPFVGAGASADAGCWGGNALGTAPSTGTDIPNKSYVDGLASGLHVLASSTYATAALLPNSPTYSNGASGVGATLTAGSNTTLTVDGTVAALNDVILVKNQTSTFQNGIYTVTAVGSGSVPWVLTRATYFDQAAEMLAGSYTFITNGDTLSGTSWVLAASVTTVGTDPLTWNLFFNNGKGQVYAATLTRNGSNQGWVPPVSNLYHLFIPTAPVNDNQGGLWASRVGTINAAFIPPSGTKRILLMAQVWVSSGAATFNSPGVSPSIAFKWYKNADVDGNNNITTGQQICTGLGAKSTFADDSTVGVAVCYDKPQPGDYYNLFMFVDSTVPGTTTVIVDGNPAHTFMQATVLN